MISEYIHAALSHAKYELLPNDEGFYAEVPELPGIWSNADSLEDCRRELMEVVEGWIVVKLRHNNSNFPVLDGISRQEWEQL